MTQQFILDENVVIFAQLGENEAEESDPTCMNLLEQIIEICHTLVIDPDLWGKYHSQLSQTRYAHPQLGARVLRVLRKATQMSNKVDVRTKNARPFPKEGDIPQGSQDDVPIVRLAVETGAALVTTDGRLVENLNSCGVTEAYSLHILLPDEALKGLAP